VKESEYSALARTHYYLSTECKAPFCSFSHANREAE
jgi:hypothetical protein